MGVAFSSLFPNLTDSQKEKAKQLGITEDEMRSRLEKIHGMEHPNVSIIIPVYNGEKYLQYAIESALSQSYTSKEIIVIDDGSTDKSLDIALRYDGITVLVKPNGGTASALNTGIRNAKGQWIKWLSADDELLPNAIQTMMDNVTIKKAIYYTHYIRISADSTTIKHFKEPDRNTRTQEENKKELMQYFYGNGSSSLIHKSVFEECGMFDESLSHSEDYDFWLRCTHLHNIPMILIPYFTLNYRVHPDQLTNKVGGSLDGIIKERINAKLTTV